MTKKLDSVANVAYSEHDCTYNKWVYVGLGFLSLFMVLRSNREFFTQMETSIYADHLLNQLHKF